MVPVRPKAWQQGVLGIVVASLALAGCLTASVPVPDGPGEVTSPLLLPSDGARGLDLEWALHDCLVVVGAVLVDEARIAPYVPEGFTLNHRSPLPLPVGVPLPEQPHLGFEAFRCARGAGLDGPVSDMAYASFWSSVEPPAHLVDEGFDGGHYLKWDPLVPDAPRRAAMRNAGVPVRAGSADVTLDLQATPDGPAGTFAGSARFDGLGVLTMQGVAHDGSDPVDSWPFQEYTPTEDGTQLALWRAQYDSSGTVFGEGVVTFPEGSWAAEVVGSTEARSRMWVGTWTFHSGSVRLADVAPPAMEADAMDEQP